MATARRRVRVWLAHAGYAPKAPDCGLDRIDAIQSKIALYKETPLAGITQTQGSDQRDVKHLRANPWRIALLSNEWAAYFVCD